MVWIRLISVAFSLPTLTSSWSSSPSSSTRTTTPPTHHYHHQSITPPTDHNNHPTDPSRRSYLNTALTLPLPLILPLTTTTIIPTPSSAFPNAIPESKQYANKPKRKGDPPKDLGILTRTTEGPDGDEIKSPRLRTCDGNPNCFSTTGDALIVDRQQYGVDFLIPLWIPPSPPKDDDDDGGGGGDKVRPPLEAIRAVVDTYEPGQGGIDGGGFERRVSTDTYLYYRFESLKKGYVDDVEFALTEDGGRVMVRSASRVGVTDFGVNAIRLNYIAGRLRSRGWTIGEITPETHRDYWTAASEAREATFDSDRRNLIDP